MDKPKIDLVVRNITEAELEPLLSTLKEASRWLKAAQNEMWKEEEFTVERFLKEYRQSEMYSGYVNDMEAATMVLQEEDPIFWPNVKENESIFIH